MVIRAVAGAGHPVRQRALDAHRDRKTGGAGDRDRAMRLANRDHPDAERHVRGGEMPSRQRRHLARRYDHRDLGHARDLCGGRDVRRKAHRHRGRAADRLHPCEEHRIALERIRHLVPGLAERIGRDEDAGGGGIDQRGLDGAETCDLEMIAGRPVGSRRPVRVPPGSTNSSRTGAPCPPTPSIVMSPSISTSPSFMGKHATMILPVLVL